MDCDDVSQLPPDDDAVVQLVWQASMLILLAHVLHQVLRRFGQPSVVSQILAGIILGNSVLGRLQGWRAIFRSDRDYLADVAAGGRLFFMYLIGLEMDLPYLRRTASRSGLVAIAGAVGCLVTALMSLVLVYKPMGSQGDKVWFVMAMTLLYSNTSTPMLARMMTELKLSTSEVGRLAISTALINDLAGLIILSILSLIPFRNGMAFKPNKSGGQRSSVSAAIGGFFIVLLVALVSRPAIRLVNRKNKRRRHIKNWDAVVVLLAVYWLSSTVEMFGYNSMMAAFVFGAVTPREGPTARTLIDWLTYPVNKIFLPVYFGYAGMLANFDGMEHWDTVKMVLTIVILSTVGKVSGTVLATNYLGIPLREGLVLAFLLNVKGHIDLLVLTFSRKAGIWTLTGFNVMMITIVLSTLTAGPAADIMVRLERRALKYRSIGLEWQPLESEMRLLSCVHSPRDVPTILSLVEISSGTSKTPVSAYVIHLVELTKRVTTAMLYHQRQDDDGNGGWECGDNSRRISAAVDVFRRQTGFTIRQVTAVSSFVSMHEDVCNGAADVRASLVLTPFHKYQRIDGKMYDGKEGHRAVNEKLLRHAPCSVGILVDRGLDGTSQESSGMFYVLAIFIGGPDDREALAYASRLAMHPCVSLTVMRFSPASKGDYEAMIETIATKDDEVLIAVSKHENERNSDETFLKEFFTRFVNTGLATYVEKFVDNGAEVVTVLSSAVGMYSLYVVGNGRRGPTPLTMGLKDWEECPELGVIGDLLGSSDFMTSGSVLVIQQYNGSKKHDIDEEFTVM